MNDPIVINASPLIALGKMGMLGLVRELPIIIITPTEVKQELDAGVEVGHLIEFPGWIEVRDLGLPIESNLLDRLDSGEAAVIQLALEIGVDTVCLDEIKGRRIAKEFGLTVMGSLGILGKAKKLGIVNKVKPYVLSAIDGGIYYDDRLLERFLKEFGE